MESTLLVVAWIGGVCSGGILVLGGLTFVSGRVAFNPARIDWSTTEARALGLICIAQGLVIGVVTVATTLQLAANLDAPPWGLPLILVGGLGGFIAIVLIGQRHNSRNPSKRW